MSIQQNSSGRTLSQIKLLTEIATRIFQHNTKVSFPFINRGLHPGLVDSARLFQYQNHFATSFHHTYNGIFRNRYRADHHYAIEFADHPYSIINSWHGRSLPYTKILTYQDEVLKAYNSVPQTQFLCWSEKSESIFTKFFRIKNPENVHNIKPCFKDNQKKETSSVRSQRKNFIILASHNVGKFADFINHSKFLQSQNVKIVSPQSFKITTDAKHTTHHTIPKLNHRKKKELYEWADISINLSLTDGILPFESLSYGVPCFSTPTLAVYDYSTRYPYTCADGLPNIDEVFNPINKRRWNNGNEYMDFISNEYRVEKAVSEKNDQKLHEMTQKLTSARTDATTFYLSELSPLARKRKLEVIYEKL